MHYWYMDKSKVKTQTLNSIMGELESLIDGTAQTANYWIDNAHNVSAFINDNGDDDKWIEIHYELYAHKESWIGDLLLIETEYTDRDELFKAVAIIVDYYYGD